MRKLRRRLWRDERGLAGVEFALILPVLVLFSLVMIETSRFLLLNLKLSHVATSMGDLATRERELSVGTLDNLFNSVQHLIQPFPFETMGVVIVSGVTEDAGNAMTVSWQRRGAGDLDPTSGGGDGGRRRHPAGNHRRRRRPDDGRLRSVLPISAVAARRHPGAAAPPRRLLPAPPRSVDAAPGRVTPI